MDTDIIKDNPFVGLRAFEEDEGYLFFGRKTEINDLLKKFSGSRFLAVIGSSGSGKSSLVKSGLLPAIHSGSLASGHDWHVATMRPEGQPLSNLAKALTEKGVLYINPSIDDNLTFKPLVESTLRRSTNGLMQAYKQSPLYDKTKTIQEGNLLILVDQFEELFRYSNPDRDPSDVESEKLHFVNLLLTASQQTELPIYVLITMRSDFLGDCAQFPGLPEAINDGQYLVPRMTRDQMKESIEGPIAVGGANIDGGAKATPRLLTRLLNDVGTDIDQLPLLQHAMMRTWKHWRDRIKNTKPNTTTANEESNDIDIIDYEEIGGMKEALSKHANEIYDELHDETKQDYCKRIFTALTDKAADVRGTRRPRKVSDLYKLTDTPVDNIKEIAEAFRKPGRTFLMPLTGAIDNDTTLDISHESLMRVWDKLKEWADEEAQNAEIFKRLADAAKRHEQGYGLYQDLDLDQALKWQAKFKNEELIELWAKPFFKDTDTTKKSLAFLHESHKADISEKQEKERLKREKEELKEAEAKRIKEEEEKEHLRKRRNNRIALAILFLFLISALGSLIWNISERQKTLEQKNKADSLYVIAHLSDSLSQIAERNAKVERDSAEAAKNRAHVSDSLSKIAAAKAIKSDSLSKIAAENARAAELRALAQKAKADTLSRTSAVGEYQRLIREGPEDSKKILNDAFQYKLIAYADHLDTLRNKYAIKAAQTKHNELYEKLYFSFKALRKLDSTITKTGNSTVANFENPNITIGDVTITATDDHKIIAKSSKHSTDTIYLGKKVTALDYDAGNNLIFFGLSDGEIGFVKYLSDRKNQPVFNRKNDLRLRITAIDYFNHKGKNYMLATSYAGLAVLFEFDTTRSVAQQLTEDVKFPVTELPEYYGEITSAHYDDPTGRIELNATGGLYLWNPFSEELLPELRKLLNDKTMRNKINESTRLYNR
jgi:hypothetical protein